jgi:hypothetical protein
MNEHQQIATALKTRLSELRTHLAKVERELHKPLNLKIWKHSKL